MLLRDLLIFSICAAIIFVAGKRVSYYGKLIATKTGIGNAWIGLVLVASVTSLPELVTGISAVTIVQSPDLAIGDIAGSCAFNLLLLSLMDLVSKKPILGCASNTHVLAASMGILFLSVVGIGLFIPADITIAGWLSAASLVAFAGYFASVRLLYKFDQGNKQKPDEDSDPDIPLKKAVLHYVISGVVIVGTAILLPYFAKNIAVASGVELTFIGTFLLAVTTSLPEIAVTRSALLAGNADMAVGNILGSNIFNIFILSLDDLFYTKGSLLFHASDLNILSIFSAIMMSAVTIGGLMLKSQKKDFLLTWDTVMILVIFLSNMVLLYWFSN